MQVASVATSYSALKLLFMFLPITSGVIAGAHNTKALFSLNGDKPWEVWFARCAGLPPLLTLVAAAQQVNQSQKLRKFFDLNRQHHFM